MQRALEASGLGSCRVVELPASTRTAAEAAAAIGCEVAQIAKSIVFRGAASGEPVLVVASGTNRVDEAAVGREAGEGLGRADGAWVKATVGYAIGGIPPLGHPSPVRTFFDPDLLRFPVVWAAAGTPNAVFEVAPEALLRACGAKLLPAAG